MSVTIASTYTRREYRWSGWKAVYSLKGLPVQFEDNGEMYTIWTYDGPEVHVCQIWKNNVPEGITASYSQAQNDSDKLDFETVYKSLSNQPLSQLDTDGASIVRVKAAKRGWTYSANAFEFDTATLNSVVALNFDGTNKSYITISLFDSTGAPILDPTLESTACRTHVDFEPPYDYEVIGGQMRITPQLSSDMRLFIMAVPDVPYAYGGSRVMAENLNLRFLYPGNVFQVDGRVSKFLQYHPTFHTNKLRFVFWHEPGIKEKLMITIEHFKQ